MNSNILIRKKYRAIFDLLLLYISKSGAIVVGIFVLPWYQKLLGASDFGLVALILALQAFFLMMDLGTSTLVGRELSAEKSFSPPRCTLRAGEVVLHFFYIFLLILALLLNRILNFNFPSIQIILGTIFFWALSVQNIGQSALMARRKYHLAAVSQIIGVLSRAFITILILHFFLADFENFLLVQSVVAVFQMLLTLYLCNKVVDKDDFEYSVNEFLPVVRNILKKGAPLVAFGLAGAAVMQMDKVIIGAWGDTKAVAAYYLASTLCLVPISVLAGPVAQYFQPKIISNLTAKDFDSSERNLKLMIMALMLAVVIPSLVLWINRELLVNLWLRGQSNTEEVIHYVKLLLPGVAIGSFGFVSYVILIAYQDYKAQAIISAAMSITTLGITAYFAKNNNVEAICIVYVIYHIFSAFAGWLRACFLQTQNGYRTFLYRDGILFFLVVVILMLILIKN